MSGTLVSRLIAITALVGLLFLGGLSAKWFLADIYGERVALSLDSWRRSGSSPTDLMLEEHLTFIEHARQWSPANARYMELEARLRLLYLPTTFGTESFGSELERMLELHRTAVQLRPHWPFSWANLSHSKSMQGDFDEEFNRALSNAVRYGPFEQAVLDRVIYAGVNAWRREQLSEESRQYFLKALANGAELSPRFARSLRERLQGQEGMRDALCAQVRFRSERGQERLCG